MRMHRSRRVKVRPWLAFSFIHAAISRAKGALALHLVAVRRNYSINVVRSWHGNWLPWREKEFGWTPETALRFMQVAEAAGKNNKLLDLAIGASSLYLLAAPSTPDEIRVVEPPGRARAKKRRSVLSETYRNFAIADFGRRAASMSTNSSHSCGVGRQLFRVGLIPRAASTAMRQLADSDSVNLGSNPGSPAIHLPDMTVYFQFPRAPE
jgi:hypothetical protein